MHDGSREAHDGHPRGLGVELGRNKKPPESTSPLGFAARNIAVLQVQGDGPVVR